ncbi:hypothetical protein NPIL_65351 [Nephila pilipes]|uniref:Uncharacterized protein n=1 Tax=Nephila pilipes TaxID=299642 RepID=A0A8X6P435_NEPPI|nr:hypothetical protein NPIL_65351 [Nephila pilipes]
MQICPAVDLLHGSFQMTKQYVVKYKFFKRPVVHKNNKMVNTNPLGLTNRPDPGDSRATFDAVHQEDSESGQRFQEVQDGDQGHAQPDTHKTTQKTKQLDTLREKKNKKKTYFI